MSEWISYGATRQSGGDVLSVPLAPLEPAHRAWVVISLPHYLRILGSAQQMPLLELTGTLHSPLLEPTVARHSRANASQCRGWEDFSPQLPALSLNFRLSLG